jgi:HlyD family secretion protein
MKSKIIKALIICIVVAGIGTGGYFGYKKVFAAKTTVSAVSYITMRASKMNLKVNIQGTGPAYAANSREVAAGANGTLSSLNVKVGDTIVVETSGCDYDSKAIVTKIESSTEYRDHKNVIRVV